MEVSIQRADFGINKGQMKGTMNGSMKKKNKRMGVVTGREKEV